MVCPHCAKEMDEAAAFCRWCGKAPGTAIDQAPAPAPAEAPAEPPCRRCAKKGKTVQLVLKEEMLTCPACGAVRETAAQKRTSTINAIYLIAAIAVAIALGGWKVYSEMQPPPLAERKRLAAAAAKQSAEQQRKLATTAAKQFTLKVLASPKSAEFEAVRLKQEKAPHYLFHVLVDSKNAFGVMLRSSFCVAIEMVPGSDEYKFNRQLGIQECPDPPSAEFLAIMTAANGWPDCK